MLEQIDRWVSDKKQAIFEMYEYLHQHAEISWEEKQTTEFVIKELKKLSIPYERFDDQTGAIGLWKGDAEGPIIGIRTDMDALWQNVEGEWKANHSCGHDAHMTILLITLQCLKELGIKPNGMIKSFFQPAEETGGGAISFIEKGVMEDVDYLLGLHVRPIQEIRYGECSPAIYHGASAFLKGKIYGLQAHAARPHLGVNVIDSLTAINLAIRSIPLNPVIPSSIKMTHVHTEGKNFNTIPDYAEFILDIRAQTNEKMDELKKTIENVILQAGKNNGSKIELEWLSEMPAAKSNKWMESIVAASIVDVLGPDGLVQAPITPGGEDFHFYSKKQKGLKATMIGLGTDLQPGLHHPLMSFHLDSLLIGVKVMSLSILRLMKQIK